MEAAFVLGVIFAFIVILVAVDARKKERMFLLRQGKDPNLADTKNNIFSAVNYLKWGIIIISVGVGTLLGTIFRDNSMFVAFLMIFSGIGIVASYLVSRHLTQNDRKNEKNTDVQEV